MPAKSKSNNFDNVSKAVKSGKKILKTVSKAAQLAQGAKGILGRAKEAAGKSKCEGKKCSWKEKLEDFAERAIRGGKSIFGEREKIKSMVEEGKRLVSGESVKKSKSMKPKKEMNAKPSAPLPPPAPSPVPVASSKKSMPSSSREGLLEDIRKGKSLRKVQMPEKKNSMSKGNDMYDELYKKMQSRRKYLRNVDED